MIKIPNKKEFKVKTIIGIIVIPNTRVDYADAKKKKNTNKRPKKNFPFQENCFVRKIKSDNFDGYYTVLFEFYLMMNMNRRLTTIR